MFLLEFGFTKYFQADFHLDQGHLFKSIYKDTFVGREYGQYFTDVHTFKISMYYYKVQVCMCVCVCKFGSYNEVYRVKFIGTGEME